MAQFTLSTAWTKVASAGSTVQLAVASGAVILGAGAGQPAAGDDGQAMTISPYTMGPLGSDLWARAGAGGAGVLNVYPVNTSGSSGSGSTSAATVTAASLATVIAGLPTNPPTAANVLWSNAGVPTLSQ